MDGCRAVVVAEKYAAEIEAVRDELPDLEHVLVRDSEYESWLARRSAVDPDPAIRCRRLFHHPPRRRHDRRRLTGAANAPPACSRFPASRRP
jgi:hypothetical protein